MHFTRLNTCKIMLSHLTEQMDSAGHSLGCSGFIMLFITVGDVPPKLRVKIFYMSVFNINTTLCTIRKINQQQTLLYDNVNEGLEAAVSDMFNFQ